MSIRPWIALTALVGASLAMAKEPSKAGDPASPAAIVPAPVYQSAFSNYHATPPETEETPDRRWRAGNDAPNRDTEGAGNGHGDHSGHAKQNGTPERTSSPVPTHYGEGT